MVRIMDVTIDVTAVRIMQIIDGMVILLGLYVFGLHATLYAIVSIYILAKISDAILEGFKYSKAAYIITNEYEEVAKRLMEELDRGVTGLDGVTAVHLGAVIGGGGHLQPGLCHDGFCSDRQFSDG